MAFTFHITIMELNALNTKGKNSFKNLVGLINFLMEAKIRGLEKIRIATTLITRLKILNTKRQNLFQKLDAVIHLLMEAKHWGLRKSRNATSLNSRFKSLDTLKVKIISVTFRRVIRTNHKKASKIWRHENIQLGGCQS